MNIRNRYEWNTHVWHVVTGQKGIVLDWTYRRSLDKVQYLVSVDFGQDYWVDEIEISDEKVIEI